MTDDISRIIDISILIVNYNGMKLLDDCITSIKAYSSGFDYEIIVIDNHSSESIEVVKEKHADVKFIMNEDNRGFAAANNQGLALAKGKYILYLNNDTLFTENTLLILLPYIKGLPPGVVLGCTLLNADKTLQVSTSDFDTVWNSLGENLFLYKVFPRSKLFNKYHLTYYTGQEPVETDIVKGAFLLCRKDLADTLHGFDESFYFYSEEADFCFRAKKLGVRVLYCPETSIIHFGGATTDSMPWFSHENIHRSRVRYYLKNTHGYLRVGLLIMHYLGILIRGFLYTGIGCLILNKKQFTRGLYYFKRLFLKIG
jgi:GT2 family glycosyltransferase